MSARITATVIAISFAARVEASVVLDFVFDDGAPLEVPSCVVSIDPDGSLVPDDVSGGREFYNDVFYEGGFYYENGPYAGNFLELEIDGGSGRSNLFHETCRPFDLVSMDASYFDRSLNAPDGPNLLLSGYLQGELTTEIALRLGESRGPDSVYQFGNLLSGIDFLRLELVNLSPQCPDVFYCNAALVHEMRLTPVPLPGALSALLLAMGSLGVFSFLRRPPTT